MTRVVDFVCAYPELGRNYQNYLWGAFEQAILHRSIDSRTPMNRKEARGALLREAERLPDRRVLTDGFLAMRMYIDYGVDLFSLRKTAAGKQAKILLRKLRNIRSRIGTVSGKQK